MPDEDALHTLGFVEGDGEAQRATPRFRAAIARAALGLLRAGSEEDDLRLPIARAVLELRPDLDDDEVAALVVAVLPIAARDL